ncbi:hypothetical protein L227DRAFT_567777 [Lentinus tigrinus ALCF2SS1-6]|uniref:Uncharacterized protein n=1 Tax=Lentinus tigrinus ALCF2SS1-6 TaxID=1328759 RepID=A0A5C2RR97_9APHY|nr:hypothetical protein L227DRAFT_567777 [Lentinus tigrinus ALCF2SS1-6]
MSVLTAVARSARPGAHAMVPAASLLLARTAVLRTSALPEEHIKHQSALKCNRGGHINHSNLAPQSQCGGKLAVGLLKDALVTHLGSVDVSQHQLQQQRPHQPRSFSLAAAWARQRQIRFYALSLEVDDYQFPPPSPSASSPSRTERLALTVAEQMPALRCVLVEIPHDSRRRPYQFTFDSLAQSNPPRLSSTPSGNGNGAADDGQRRYERRFWRIDGSEEFLCVEPLTDAAARRLMDAEGLSFEDRVRYW